MKSLEVEKIVDQINNSDLGINESVKELIVNDNKDISLIVSALLTMLHQSKKDIKKLNSEIGKEYLDDLISIKESELFETYKLAKKSGCKMKLLVE